VKTKDLFPSKYLKAADLAGDEIVTICQAKLEKVGQSEDEPKKLVLYFEESPKGLVLNKTNCKTLEKLHGDDTDRWIGKSIAIYPTEVQYMDDMVEAIRIRLRAPAPLARTLQREPGDESEQPDIE
jgi:hypothetical protein